MKAKDKEQEPNRKTITKSITEIKQNLDNATEEELEYLKNNFQYDTSPAYLESLQADLLSKPDRPITFEKPIFIIHPTLLVKQFNTIQKTQRDLVLHDFEKDSTAYRKLYEWVGFQLTQDLFSFVHYQLYGTQFKRIGFQIDSVKNLPLDLGLVKNLQRVLIESKTRPAAQYKTKELILALENLLDSNLTEIILHFSLVIFVFEWIGLEDGKFRTLVAFQYHSSTLPSFLKSKTDPHKPLVLDGDDLFDNFLGSDNEPLGEESTIITEGLELMKLRRLLRDSELSYLYYGFSRK